MVPGCETISYATDSNDRFRPKAGIRSWSGPYDQIGYRCPELTWGLSFASFAGRVSGLETGQPRTQCVATSAGPAS